MPANAAAQRVEHYEMAVMAAPEHTPSYVEMEDGAQLLQTTLTEELDTDKKLTKLAKSAINVGGEIIKLMASWLRSVVPAPINSNEGP